MVVNLLFMGVCVQSHAKAALKRCALRWLSTLREALHADSHKSNAAPQWSFASNAFRLAKLLGNDDDDCDYILAPLASRMLDDSSLSVIEQCHAL